MELKYVQTIIIIFSVNYPLVKSSERFAITSSIYAQSVPLPKIMPWYIQPIRVESQQIFPLYYCGSLSYYNASGNFKFDKIYGSYLHHLATEVLQRLKKKNNNKYKQASEQHTNKQGVHSKVDIDFPDIFVTFLSIQTDIKILANFKELNSNLFSSFTSYVQVSSSFRRYYILKYNKLCK